ncbi:MAG: hypothetical protein M5R38_04100 [Candidatus Methylomirabilis sp.]|nr:hypothetical protein [Candidatus Methylomirabilis sp.]
MTRTILHVANPEERDRCRVFWSSELGKGLQNYATLEAAIGGKSMNDERFTIDCHNQPDVRESRGVALREDEPCHDVPASSKDKVPIHEVESRLPIRNARGGLGSRHGEGDVPDEGKGENGYEGRRSIYPP